MIPQPADRRRPPLRLTIIDHWTNINHAEVYGYRRRREYAKICLLFALTTFANICWVKTGLDVLVAYAIHRIQADATRKVHRLVLETKESFLLPGFRRTRNNEFDIFKWSVCYDTVHTVPQSPAIERRPISTST